MSTTNQGTQTRTSQDWASQDHPADIDPTENAEESNLRALFVLGPSSSGKTTLCDAVAKSLNMNPSRYIKEIARNVMREQGFSRADVDTYEMQNAIMAAQLRAEQNVLQISEREDVGLILLSDRSAIDPIVYAGTSVVPGASSRRQLLLEDAGLQEMFPLYRRSKFIILPPVEEWIQDDGVRSLEDPWTYNETLYATLQEIGIPFVRLGEETKDIRERVDFVKRLLGLL